MKVCPKCGYFETIPWRQNRWRLDVEFCWVEQFREEYIEIYNKLVSGIEVVCDIIYAYRIAGKGKNLVERVLICYYKSNGIKAFSMTYDKGR
jgi:hypothetical protein